MDTIAVDLKEDLKNTLFRTISARIDLIGYVPEDLARLAGSAALKATAAERPAETAEPKAPGRAGVEAQVNELYDEIFYNKGSAMKLLLGETEYGNFGYWNDTTRTQHQASERLLDTLLDFIPEKTGRILDVACGLGASTRHLLNHYPPENVWAINISEKQIGSVRKNAPGCNAMVMTAVDMAFEDAFFDNILCVEAAFHFETRRAFLESARRILKDGGRLVMSDILLTSRERMEQFPVFPSPDNHLSSADEYRELLNDVGFRDVVVQDVTRDVWGAHFQHVARRAHEELFLGTLNIVQTMDILWTHYLINAITGPCLFVSARK
ncbi:MAG TPA: methyltransferase domain-containing protein [Azospirillum sp.]